MKPFIKRDKRTDARTDARTDIGHFIISRPGPIGRREIKMVQKFFLKTYNKIINFEKHIPKIVGICYDEFLYFSPTFF